MALSVHGALSGFPRKLSGTIAMTKVNACLESRGAYLLVFPCRCETDESPVRKTAFMSSNESATKHSNKIAGVGFCVGCHLAIGLLLMWLDPMASLFGEQAREVIGLRPLHSLLPCLGLFWMLVAVALISGRGFVIKTAMAAHCAALLLPVAGIVLAIILLLPPEPQGSIRTERSPVPRVLENVFRDL